MCWANVGLKWLDTAVEAHRERPAVWASAKSALEAGRTVDGLVTSLTGMMFFFRWILSKWRNFLDFWVNDVVYQLIRSSTKSRTQEFHILSINCSWSQQHERASRCWQHPSIQFQNKEQRLKPYQQHPATKTYSCASCRANTPSSPPSQSTQHQNTWQIGARMLQCFSDFQCQDLAIRCSPFWIIIHCLIQYDYHDTISLGRRNQSIWGHFPFWSWLRGAGTSS